MKFISAKHNEPFMLVAFPGDRKDEFVVRMVPLGKGSCALCGVQAEWVAVLDEASLEVQQEAYISTMGGE
jgi:hypothetical protein